MGNRNAVGKKGNGKLGNLAIVFVHGSFCPVDYLAIVQKWVPYSQRYLFNAIPDTNHNTNPTNPNRYSKSNPNPTYPTNPTKANTRYRCE